MAAKFKNKYRIESTRLQNWDYRWAGAYFITICTDNREHFFGEIVNGKMILSNVGVLANVFWYEIKNHSKNVQLGEFTVMPNHVHGILILDDGDILNDPQIINTTDSAVMVETLHATSLPSPSSPTSPSSPPVTPPISIPIKNETMANISPISNSISTIIRSYKSAVTKHANRLGFEFAWQTRFHDHIIRDEQSFNNISYYIINNPKNWDKDKFRIIPS